MREEDVDYFLIGEVTDKKDIRVTSNGAEIHLKTPGFDHFRLNT